MASLAYDLAPHLATFRDDTNEGEPKDGKESRFAVLVYLVLRSNKRNRAFPSVETIAKETGFSKSRITNSLEWLRNRKAIYNVEPDKRVGREKFVRSNHAVYQLTGAILLMGKLVNYLYLHPEEPDDQDEFENGSESEPIDNKRVNPDDQSVHLTEGIGSLNSHLPLYELEESNEDEEKREPAQPTIEPIEPQKETSSSTPEFKVDTDLAEVIRVYEKNVDMIATVIVTGNEKTIGMSEALQVYPKDWIIEAIELSAIRRKASWGYALGILSRWKANGKDSPGGKQPGGGESPAAPQMKWELRREPDCKCDEYGTVKHEDGSMSRCPKCWHKVQAGGAS